MIDTSNRVIVVVEIDMVVVVVMVVDMEGQEGTHLLLEEEDRTPAPAQGPQEGPDLQGGALPLHATTEDLSQDHLTGALCLLKESLIPEADLAPDQAVHVLAVAVVTVAVVASQSKRSQRRNAIKKGAGVYNEARLILILRDYSHNMIGFGVILADYNPEINEYVLFLWVTLSPTLFYVEISRSFFIFIDA